MGTLHPSKKEERELLWRGLRGHQPATLHCTSHTAHVPELPTLPTPSHPIPLVPPDLAAVVKGLVLGPLVVRLVHFVHSADACRFLQGARRNDGEGAGVTGGRRLQQKRRGVLGAAMSGPHASAGVVQDLLPLKCSTAQHSAAACMGSTLLAWRCTPCAYLVLAPAGQEDGGKKEHEWVPSNTCRAADAVSADMSGRWRHTSHNTCQAWTAACAGVGQQSTGTELARPPLPHLSTFRHSVTSCPTVTVRCRALRGSVGGNKAKRGGSIDHRAPAPWQGRPRRRSAQSARFATSPFTVSLARTRNLMAICSFTLPQGAGLANAELGRPCRRACPAGTQTQQLNSLK